MYLKKDKILLILTGLVVALFSTLLVYFGNPGNMGFCIACFIRDIAGSVKLHSTQTVQYMRPEIIGLVLGSFAVSLITGEFRPRGGSSPFLRFAIGFIVAVGALVFLGCPLRMVLRLSAGDLNALVGLVGFILGIFTGCLFLNAGFSLGRAEKQSALEGSAISLINIIFFVILIAFPSLLAFSTSGPGSMRAPVFLSLLAGLAVGAAAQKSRMCFAGGIRDTFLIKDFTLLFALLSVFIFNLVFSLLTGTFKLSFSSQSVAHQAQLWNLLGLYAVGFGSVLIGGCPLRQLILAGEGNSDSAISTLGFFIGAAFAHNFSLASSAASAESIGGPSLRGKVVLIILIAFLFLIAATVTIKNRRKEDEGI